ncbi:gp30 [Burkholderia pseudomallei]|uniref:Phage-related protein n=1 Tax=Burkholderia pseudomallei (strain K96243) TaxID=272560 RepID=Q63NA8_BURPS|nr:VRR-NUC domain-containing protein [Burkholderia pseudomallei]AIV86593.1 VRR-NUC domain protein [Burkholderia pseudomallei B03]AIV93901.1 VRR-NUC domain protein [Burkholderia pseudomallei A79A]AJX26420.1 VRR-NUC domain protein [Burkholderia pseudomallei K96243]AYX38932.1 VRR-NUC domain-containing protein [Burkholderia pseudomallei]EIF69297.1 Putative phage related protein [Burkholderia pseudomallei 354e]
MSGGYAPGASPGGMSAGSGQTTQVGLSAARLSPKDREVLCHTFCECRRIGIATKAGTIQRQRCVQMRLGLPNEVSKMQTGVPTEYRPEQPYDMTTQPPEPIMDYDDPLEPHSSIRQWIKDVWPDKGKKYQKGDVRRPDVVIVNDPSKPPVQSNIKTVVEMKFPGDSYGPDQEDDYIEIAGSPSKFAHLGAADCGCGNDDGQKKTARSKQSARQSDLDELFGGNSSAPGSPPLPPMPLPPLPAFP